MNVDVLVVGSYQVNCYIVWDQNTKEGCIIDPGFECDKIESLLNKKQIIPKCIINTHGHADHIGCNTMRNLPIYIHKADARFLMDPNLNLSLMHGIEIVSPQAERLLEDNDSIDVAGATIKVIHTPGHTPGCICLQLDQYLFTGDTLFRNSIGRTDLPYGDSRQIIVSIKNKLLPLDDELVVYPGHGPASELGWEKKHNYFLHV